MKLLDDIIELSTLADAPLTVILRKLLVLSYTLKNRLLTTWATKELDGYESDDELPPYRKVRAIAKGTFLGPFGAQINNQPLPAAVLKPAHRAYAEHAYLKGPIAGLEDAVREVKDIGVMAWPPDLTMLYQAEFIEGYALNRAWQELPKAAFVSLVDTVRNRTLRFALELREELGEVNDQVDALPAAVIDKTVSTQIFNNSNVVIAGSAQHFSLAQNQIISAGDINALSTALDSLGIGKAEVTELQTALDQDKAHATEPSLGQRTAKWLTGIGSTIGKTGLNVGVETAKAAATKAVMQYLGLG